MAHLVYDVHPVRKSKRVILSRFVELDAPLFDKLDVLKQPLLICISRQLSFVARLIFVDEAHSIERIPNGYEFLLKMVEEPKPGIAFCFATTEFDRISKALRSRLLEIEIRPLGLDLAITFLRDIADKEGIRYEDEALALLAGFGQRSASRSPASARSGPRGW